MSESRKVEKKRNRKFPAIQYIFEFNRIVIQDLDLVRLQLSDTLDSPVIRAGHTEA